jgi:S-adenosylmethionine/arginine decarboxylase-like enzyme
MPEHKHLIIRAEVNNPMMGEKEIKKWLRNLVNKIEMKIIKGPYAAYVSKEGNRGLTAIVMIETSHIAIHIWDETSPALVQCDVYSCAEFSSNEVLVEFMEMEPIKIEHMLLDRAVEIKTLTHSTSAHKSSPIFQEGIYG